MSVPETQALGLEPLKRPATPFKFLKYYEDTERDRASFGGRQREVAEIVDAATYTSTLVLYGKSGLGKTSLLLAGVFPALRERGYLPVHIRTLQDPVQDLCRAVMEAVPNSSQVSGLEGPLDQMIQMLKEASHDLPLVLVLDQFEEFFIRFRRQSEVHRTFLEAVAAIVQEPKIRAHVVFSLREDYLADLDDFRALLPSLFDNEYRLRAMSPFAMRDAITRPLEFGRIPYDPRLVSRLVDQLVLMHSDSVVLAILCQEVFEQAVHRSPENVELTVGDLQTVGDVSLVFERRLLEAIEGLDKARQLALRVVLHSLLAQHDTKQAMRIGDFTHLLCRLRPEEIQEVLLRLQKHDLIRVDVRGDTWYELTHERLVPVVEKWARRDDAFNSLLLGHDVISTTVRGGMWRDGTKSLLTAGFLADVLGPFRGDIGLSSDELEFVVRSAIYHSDPGLEVWVERYGKPESAEILLAYLRSKDPALRLAAAACAARNGGEERMSEALLKVALQDPVESVRSAAARALRALGNQVSYRGLASALGHRQWPWHRIFEPETSARALEALAEIHLAGETLSFLSPWTRWRVREQALRAAQQRVAEEETSIRSAARISGTRGALAWGLIEFLLGSILEIRNPDAAIDSYFMFLVFTIVGIPLVGLLICPRIVQRAAVNACLPPRKNWGALLVPSRFVMVLLLLVWLSLVAVASETRLWLLTVAMAIVFYLGMRFAEWGASDASGQLSRIGWAVVASLGIPAIAVGVLLVCKTRGLEANGWATGLAAVGMLTASCAAAFRSVLGQQRGGLDSVLTHASRLGRRVNLALMVIGLGTVVAGLWPVAMPSAAPPRAPALDGGVPGVIP